MRIAVSVASTDWKSALEYSDADLRIRLDNRMEVKGSAVEHEVMTLHDYIFGRVTIFFVKREGFTMSYRAFSSIMLREVECKVGHTALTLDIFKGDGRHAFFRYCFTEREVVGSLVVNIVIKDTVFEPNFYHGRGNGIIDKIVRRMYLMNSDVVSLTVMGDRMMKILDMVKSSMVDAIRGYVTLENHIRRMNAVCDGLEVKEILDAMSKIDGKSVTNPVISTHRGKVLAFVKDETLLMSRFDLLKGYDFIIFGEKFYDRYRRLFYFSIAPYGNKFMIEPLSSSSVCDLSVDNTTKFIINMLDIQQSDMIRVSFLSEKGKIAYITFLYEESLVLSFRGSSTARDFIYDFKCEYSAFFDGYAHDGVLRLAQEFLSNELDKMISDMKRHNRKKLIVTGHSLGAGIATIVSYFLIRKGVIKKNNIEVRLFSPVPTLSENLAKAYLDNFISLTLMNDPIPHTSYGSVCKFLYLCNSLGCSDYESSDGDTVSKTIDRITDHLKNGKLYPCLYVPGIMIQLNVLSGNKGGLADLFNIFSVENEDSLKSKVTLAKLYGYQFSEDIIADTDAFLHHIPRSILNAIRLGVLMGKKASV